MAGIVIAGRTLPIGWAVIPYPWPKGRFRTTTLYPQRSKAQQHALEAIYKEAGCALLGPHRR